MKQPELGKKISEMRKAKGLTQEELVELCNLNVRTIQRIEAGEVTPRSYTIKTLFNALGMEWLEQNSDFEPLIDTAKTEVYWLYAGFAGGLVYFFLSYFEITYDIAWLEAEQINTTSYVLIKVGVLSTFSLFIYGLIKLTTVFPNKFLQIALWVMLIANAVWLTVDLISISTSIFHIEDYYFVKLGTFGLAYGMMGAGFLCYKRLWSNIPQVVGALGIVAGIMIFTVVGALLALIPLTLFEIGELGLLIYASTKIGRTSSPDSTFSTEFQP
jgi:transcriptional regulator with XRE-family HTH domain